MLVPMQLNMARVKLTQFMFMFMSTDFKWAFSSAWYSV